MLKVTCLEAGRGTLAVLTDPSWNELEVGIAFPVNGSVKQTGSSDGADPGPVLIETPLVLQFRRECQYDCARFRRHKPDIFGWGTSTKREPTSIGGRLASS